MTRPEPDAARTAAALVALGHQPIVAPLLAFEALPPPETLPRPAALLLSSANAARAIALWPESLLPRAIPVVAVGDRTAEAAREAGFTDVASAAGDGEALVALVGATLAADAGPLLYAAAAEPARDIAGMLGAAGYAVTHVSAYRMARVGRLPEPARLALAQGDVDGVLLYSRRSAAALATLTAEFRLHLAALPHYCLSAEVASGVAAGRIAVAAAPNEAALFALLPEGTETAGKD